MKYDIIWNITRLCPWDCVICCVDAHHFQVKSDRIHIRSNQLNLDLNIIESEVPSAMAIQHLQTTGIELNLAQKKQVIDNLEGLDVKIDISGGDPLFFPEAIEVIEYASTRLGKQNVTVTSTGPGLNNTELLKLSTKIAELNFTYDFPGFNTQGTRPYQYSASNLLAIRKLSEFDFKTRAECPLSKKNCNLETIEKIYKDLNSAGVDKLLLMRLFAVGRGSDHIDDIPTQAQYKSVITKLRELEKLFQKPKVKLQCALQYFDDPTIETNPCDMVTASFGLMADGTLLVSPWAYDSRGQPLDDSWVLGNLADQSLEQILSSEKVVSLQQRTNENFGHCKIFAWQTSNRSQSGERMFDKSDPIMRSIK